jgi:hypothetical protein
MGEQTSEPPAIACTLPPAEFKARLTAIAELNAAALVSHRRDDLRLELTYAAAAREQVESMVRGEQACCAFLTELLRAARRPPRRQRQCQRDETSQAPRGVRGGHERDGTDDPIRELRLQVEYLEVLERRELKQHHDEQHLGA